MKISDSNWQMVEAFLKNDDRAILPLGSTEQHAGLSLSVDSILSERVALEAAEPLGVPVFPVVAYGLTPYFLSYPRLDQPSDRDLCTAGARYPRQPQAAGFQARPHRQRPWRQPAGGKPCHRVDGPTIRTFR